MGTIKLRRGSGSPAGSLAQYEVAMDVVAKNLYTSTNGSDAVILSDNTENFLANAASTDNFLIDGSAASVDWGPPAKLGDSVLNIKTDNSGWWASQLSVEDSNGKVFSQVGQHSTAQDTYQWNITLDPDNTHGRTGVSTYPGDYFVDFQKDYTDPAAIYMKQRVFGANNGYTLSVHDDYNSNSPNPGPTGGGGYGYKPFITNVQDFQVHAKTSDTTVAIALKVDSTAADFSVPVQLPVYANDAARDAAVTSPAAGMMIFNTTGTAFQGYDGSSWVTIDVS